MARLDDLPTALRDFGVKVSVEWQPGRPHVPVDKFLGTLGHHTGGFWKDRHGRVLMTPSLAVVKRGRLEDPEPLPGPLCNGYLGRDLVARLITRGGANHPGKGGPLTLGGAVIPRHNARPYLVGWEIEHSGKAAEPWTDEMLETSARCFAATLQLLGVGPERHSEHHTWAARRKPDRLGITEAAARQQISAALAARRPRQTPQEGEFDMEEQRLRKIIQDEVRKEIKTVLGNINGPDDPTHYALNDVRTDLRAIKAKLGV